MSGYSYDFSPTPARSGWRSVLTGFLTIVAVVAVSTISGAVVTLELLAPSSQRDAQMRDAQIRDAQIRDAQIRDAQVRDVSRDVSDAKIVASAPRQVIQQQSVQTQPARPAPEAVAKSGATTSTATPRAASTETVASIQGQPAPSRAPAQSPAQTAATSAANTASPTNAAQPAPPASQPAAPTTAVAPAQPEIADSELTFAKGYARRQAAKQAATKIAAGKNRLADVGAAVNDVRTSVKVARAKPRQQTVERQDARRPDAYWSANRYDFDRHQALAFGESSRQQQRRAPSGPFGFFDHLF